MCRVRSRWCGQRRSTVDVILNLYIIDITINCVNNYLLATKFTERFPSTRLSFFFSPLYDMINRSDYILLPCEWIWKKYKLIPARSKELTNNRSSCTRIPIMNRYVFRGGKKKANPRWKWIDERISPRTNISSNPFNKIRTDKGEMRDIFEIAKRT